MTWMVLTQALLMMNSTHHFNQRKENPENEAIASFSFSYERDKKVVPIDLLAKAKFALQEILNTRHSHHEKRTVLPKSGRWNFACPYCGDSSTDPHKKRGNIYTDKFYYKCYNCGKYKDLHRFLKDFQKDVLSVEEAIYVQEAEASTRMDGSKIDPSFLFNVEILKKYAIKRSTIEEKLRLKNIDQSKILTYLKKRLQPRIGMFSWCQEREQLYIFHTIPDTDLVLGYQVRNFKSSPKYMTYRLSKIREMMDLPVNEEIMEIDLISTTFGILEANLSSPITVFEGPLDSFLYKNSVATCSSNIDFPIDVSTLRYFYDYDKAGRDAAIKKLESGWPVFLWKKFFKDANIDEPTNKKMDLTDLVVLAKRKGISLPRLSDYFSKDKYDAYWI